ncbi:MAG: type IV-A pilus assembly ATPase PilB [Oceanococcaceae bacterium]
MSQGPSASTAKGYIGGLARRLVAEKLLDEEKARSAQQEALKAKLPLVRHLSEKGLVKPRQLAEAASAEFGAPILDLTAFKRDTTVLEKVDPKLIEKHHVLPLFVRGKRLFLGIADPTQLDAIDEVKFQTGLTVEPIVVDIDKLNKAVESALANMDGGMGDLDDDLEGLEVGETESGDATDLSKAGDEAPIVKFVNKMLLDAIKKGASDIHFEPYEKRYRIRLRIDGMLKEVASPPVSQAMRIAARVKVMSKLDLAEKRVPQDGRIKIILSKNKAIDFRVNSCPTLFGEKIVLRILDPSSAKLGIDALGYEPFQKEHYMKALSRPYGMILVTGPTGSGKTVSLYTGVNILNTPETNISTAEDPAEINLEGVNQVNVNPKVGLTFAAALKAFLRQDPDVILVGEIRDLETAEIAIKAAQTGHLVLSTLHTNDAPQTLTRLLNMGVPAFNIATSVTLIIAQRLARRLCSQCKKKMDIPREELLKEGFSEAQLDRPDFQIFGPVGCDQCTDGYKGRVGIYQVMPISEEMGRIIMSQGNSIQIADQATKEGIWDLRTSALAKVMQGVTSLTEANRVTID